MDMLLELAKDLGHEMQSDERFIRMQMAYSATEEDDELKELIGEFNLKRIAMSAEMSKENDEDKDEEKRARLDKELRELHDRLMKNDNMAVYQTARAEMDKLTNDIITIITLSAQGQNPDDAGSSGCGGSCSSCQGCH